MKRIVWSIAIILGSAIGILFYFWQQATATPEWYRDRASVSLSHPAAAQQARELVTAKIAAAQPQPDGTHEVYLTEQDMTAIAVTGIDRLAKHTQLTDAIESVNSTIQDGRIETGAVINLANVPINRLSPRERNIISQLRQQVPGLVNREIYVGVEGQPTIQNGQLQFDESLRIKIGRLSLTTADIAKQLGISEADLWQAIHQELGALQIEDVQVLNHQIRLRGTM